MNTIEETIIECYSKGNSINYITNLLYKRRNDKYFSINNKNIDIPKEKKIILNECRKLVEKTILEYSKKKDVVL